jgi:predicted Fe-S protein YdhL (DUF1289 family)
VGGVAEGFCAAVELSDAEREELLQLCRQHVRDRVQRKLRNSSTVMPMFLTI